MYWCVFGATFMAKPELSHIAALVAFSELPHGDFWSKTLKQTL